MNQSPNPLINIILINPLINIATRTGSNGPLVEKCL